MDEWRAYPDTMGYGKHFEQIVRAWRPDRVNARPS
jgi:hypothetical protein